LNPGVEIHGIYGGPLLDRSDLKNLSLDSVWIVPNQDGKWRWRNGDIIVAQWYRAVGHFFKFDMLHCLDWDVVYMVPVSELFAHIQDGIGLTGLLPLSKVYDTWSWVSGYPGREEWLKLLAHVQEKFGYKHSPLACMGNGMSVSRDFLGRYSEIDPTELCCSEVRLPLYAQCFDMPVHESGLRNSKYFETDDKGLNVSKVLSAFHVHGVKAFHPVRFIIPCTQESFK